ncbi:MAG: hypothetical protein MMC23_004778 [Stictis urceolatum]|nr:hypothetical protein [Stictis urceolata]
MAPYEPPPYSTALPHPRTPPDILLRTLAVQLFASTSYYHLLALLSFRKPHGAPLHPLLVLAFLLMPELLPLQLGFWILPILLSSPWRAMVARRLRALPFELGGGVAGGEPVRSRRLLMHAVFAVLNALPLAAVLGAYRQRLGMKFHAATYVGNLGLDHRNGWAAAGGTVAAVLSVFVAAGLAVVVALGEARRDEGGGGANGSAETGGDVRGREGKDGGAKIWLLGGVGEIDWPALSEVVYTALIHQILLALTNHLVPVMVLLRAWYLWLLVIWLAYWLHTKRGISREVLGLGAAVAFVAWTAGVQLWGDVIELWRCAHGQVEPWNYRWGVKDWFSAKVPKDN